MRREQKENKNAPNNHKGYRGEAILDKPRIFYTSRWYWLLRHFSIAKFFAPDRIIFHRDHLEIIRPYDPFMIQKKREILRYHRISSYSVHTGIIWSTVDIDDLGGEEAGNFVLEGVPRALGHEIDNLLHEIQDRVAHRSPHIGHDPMNPVYG